MCLMSLPEVPIEVYIGMMEILVLKHNRLIIL